jgi:RND family efflux transporter MFP subunit
MAKTKKPFRTGLVIVLLMAAVAGGVYVYRDALGDTPVGKWLRQKATASAGHVYYCPMHPNYKANKPGDCPICNMALMKLEPEKSASPTQQAKTPAHDHPAGDIYYCPMHPDYKANKPGTCPICNMNLVKLEPEKSASPTEQVKTPAHDHPAGDIYYCPMHPDYKANKPGTCPICNMNLVKREPEKREIPGQRAGTPAQARPAGERKILYWQDAMNPTHHYDKPGKAPDGMDLVPVYEQEPAVGVQAGSRGVFISSEKQQLIGVQVSPVQIEPLTKTIITVGQITYDETRVARIQSKVEGWIEQVHVDFTGKWVKKGQPLISVYSPELVSTQRELLIAKRAKESLGSSTFPEIAANARSLYDATRDRLRLWDISDAQIRDLEKRGVPSRTMTLFAPVEGFVLIRNALRGQRITPEMELYTIVDLSTVWVLADIYEYEVPMISLGQSASVTLPYFPGQTYSGKVAFIAPQLDSQTRTLKVRLQFPNPDNKLKPEMYASVSIFVDYGRQLAVPESAVLDSGTQQIVFIAQENGHFEPRSIQLGAKVNDRFIVVSGLTPGEKVVTSGNFLIDSESQLKAALTSMSDGKH